jgi:predicted O-linked N-acetylglucosamine transferase (SPINDLY family)
MTHQATAPDDAEVITRAYMKALVQQRDGQWQDAESLYRAILEVRPQHAGAKHQLGVLAVQCGRPDAGLPHLLSALEATPSHAPYWLSYLDALIQAGEIDGARSVLALGRQHGLSGAAVEALAERIDPPPAPPGRHGAEPPAQDIESLMSLFGRGRFAEMEPLARELTVRHPRHGFGWKALGAALHQQGRPLQALPALRKAALLLPASAEAHNNLGSALYDLRRTAHAEASFRRALKINPQHAEAHANLARLQRDLGRLEKARASWRNAARAEPQALRHAFHGELLLPSVAGSAADIAAWRNRFEEGIATLATAVGQLAQPGFELDPLSFQLAYHNLDDRAPMEALARLFRQHVPGLAFAAAHLPSWRAPGQDGRRLRVGLLSELLVSHTIGKLYQGLVQHLDRARFELVLIHAPRTRHDAVSEALDALADRHLRLPHGLAEQQQAVADLQLDALFYPDIGMAPCSYFLAHARLAPVQAVGWGHPDTTGLASIDYFVSAATIEPEGADVHYTETLIRMNRLPCFYQPAATPSAGSSRASLGLPAAGTLYACPQSLFKLHPDFDAVLAQIAEGDPAGCIVLIALGEPALAERLKQRWATSYPVLIERVRFLPKLSLPQFMDLMAQSDVLLDPIHFGSGNTLYEAMACGTPIVTWPGRFMRGRIVAGAYRQMGVADAPVAARLEDYAPLALALGRDPERRTRLRSALSRAAAQALFADMASVREFEQFIEAAVAAAASGRKLAAGWRPASLDAGSPR